VVSQLLHRDSFSAFDREMTDVDLVQSYIPGSLIGFGTDQLVFEVYADVTGELVDLRADQRRLFITLGLAMLVLYLALHLLVWSAQSLLKQKSIERDRAYQRMAEAELELARRKASFVAAAAHELRTPMTTIRGFGELLRDRPMERPQLRDMADAINQQAEGMSRLLDELLDLSQLDEQGKAAMRFSLQPLAPLVRSVVDSASALGMSGHDIQLEVAPGLPDVMIDAMRIKQVLLNLLSNACKFSDAGAPVRVMLLLDSPPGQGQRVGLRVEDRGCGILPEEMPYLFERFWRSPRVSKIKGTGLGMPIVKGLLELHDGSIDVASRSGGGTVVTAWLPCR
jgi:signal transduction histidine kinase